ncbi:transporter substrate-binding domain-containing protein [Arthrobacter sp. Sr33]
MTENDRWVDTLSGGDPQGMEPDLVREFASTVGADIQWSEGSEHDLAESIEQGRIDLAIGGYHDDTPWSSHAGVTRPYVESVNEQGQTVRHVMLVPRGENAFLLELDRFLLKQEVSP